MFKIEMLQAAWGDCLWIEYGNRDKPKRILIDGGITATYKLLKKRILKLPAEERHFELFVITHVDADHIEGAIKLLGRIQELNVTFGDIWFNGYEHLQGVDDDKLGGIYGEFLSALMKSRNLTWNKAFDDGKAVVVPDNGALPVKHLADGLKITLLSPTRETLKNLIPAWNAEIEKNKLTENKDVEAVLAVLEQRSALRPEVFIDDRLGEREIDVESLADSYFDEDAAEANGSSIAFLMEYDDAEDNKKKSCLLTGDAFPSLLTASLKRLISGDQTKIELDLLKVSHHGSKNNTSKELLKLLNCRNFLFSSSGQKFKHPNAETVARVLVNARGENMPQLYFNYVSEFNKMWNNTDLINGDYPYQAQYINEADDSLVIDL